GSILQPESMSGDKVLLKIPTPNSPLNYISMNHLLSSTFWVPHPTLAAQVLPVAPQATALCPGPFAINFLFGSFLSTIIIIRISFPSNILSFTLHCLSERVTWFLLLPHTHLHSQYVISPQRSTQCL
uniref:Uncharacterized protein n=1 Tax=Chrysemys picta bellii TaxID=8478 RepID=A0A8C3IX27_CHRPI